MVQGSGERPLEEGRAGGKASERGPGSVDALSAVINDIHFRDARHIFAVLGGAWQLSLPAEPDTAGFWVVLEGQLTCTLDQGNCYTAVAGDVLLFPGGHGHQMISGSTQGGRRTEYAPQLLAAMAAGERRLTLGPTGDPDSPPVSLMICRFRIDHSRARMLTSLLPEVVHVSGGNPPAWLMLGVQFARIELASPEPGNDAILNRLVDVLFIQCVRYCMDTGQISARGWLAGLRDGGLARALAAMHQHPGEMWTVATLARTAGLSRSAFAARFRELVGESPLAYLASLRMRQAEHLLRHTPMPLNAIAESLGYQSSQAFNRAFRRHMGASPGRFRRTV